MRIPALVVAAVGLAAAVRGEVAREMTPAVIQEAIASDAPPCYELEAGGRLVACFSTPFTRVAAAAQDAKARYAPFGPADVEPAILAPVVSVYAPHQGRTKVVAVVIAPAGSTDDARVIRAASSDADRKGVYATFPLSALVAGNEVRVVYDGYVCAAIPGGRPECVAPLKLEKVR